VTDSRRRLALALGLPGIVLFAGSSWLGLVFELSNLAWGLTAGVGLALMVAATRVAPGKGFRAVAPTDQHTIPRDPPH
jgi:hypothetical protein